MCHLIAYFTEQYTDYFTDTSQLWHIVVNIGELVWSWTQCTDYKLQVASLASATQSVAYARMGVMRQGGNVTKLL